MGNIRCKVESVSDSEIRCKLNNLVAGTYPVWAQISNMGYSNSFKFTHDLVIETLSTNEGKIFN